MEGGSDAVRASAPGDTGTGTAESPLGAPPRTADEPPPALYRALVARYRLAYMGANALALLGGLLLVLGGLLVVWGIAWLAGGHSGQRLAAIVLLGGCLQSFAFGVILRAAAAILRAAVDRTCFVAPGLSDDQRVRLAFEAGGGSAPR